jgi:elongation factor 2
MRGVRLNIMDIVAVHKGAGQIVPPARRAIYGAFLTAKPRLIEPVYLSEIKCC